LRLLPAQIIPVPGGAIVRRDVLQLHVRGDGVEHVLRAAFELLAAGGATREDVVARLCERFPSVGAAAAAELVSRLAGARLVIPAGEAAAAEDLEPPHELFRWSVDPSWPGPDAGLERAAVGVFGVNHVSVRIVELLRANGMTNVELVAHDGLADVRLLGEHAAISVETWREREEDGEIACLVAACSFGNAPALRALNAHAVRAGIPFLAAALVDHVGLVGPLVVPGESACLECARARENANAADPVLFRAAGEHAFVGQLVTGFHPAMPAMVADVAAMELTKFLSAALPNGLVGKLIEIDLSAPAMSVRRVLKVPRCPVCGTVNRISGANADKREYVPDVGDR
jgi:bacteriocin biosynthesis cyclodehydratase domain-containing protein